jgi:tetratricopeptide (TPR) repeat protein
LELLAAKLECSLTYLINGVTAEQMEELELGIRFARMALNNGEAAEARRRYAQLLADGSIAGLTALRQDAEYGYALAVEACGDLDGAIEILVRLRETGQDLSPERRVAIAIALCRCYRERGHLIEAVRIGEETIGRAGRPSWNDDLVELGATLLAAYLWRGDLLRAHQFAGELLAAADALDTPRSTVAACWNAALVAEQMGRGEEALALAERARAVHSENGDPRNLARIRSQYAIMLLRIRPEEAESCRDLLVRADRELGESAAGVVERAIVAIHLARAEMALGNATKAVDYALSAHGMLDEMTRGLRSEAHQVLGQAYLMLGREAEAAAEIALAAEWLDQAPRSRRTTQGWMTTAAALERLDDEEASATAYHRALAGAGL